MWHESCSSHMIHFLHRMSVACEVRDLQGCLFLPKVLMFLPYFWIRRTYVSLWKSVEAQHEAWLWSPPPRMSCHSRRTQRTRYATRIWFRFSRFSCENSQNKLKTYLSCRWYIMWLCWALDNLNGASCLLILCDDESSDVPDFVRKSLSA